MAAFCKALAVQSEGADRGPHLCIVELDPTVEVAAREVVVGTARTFDSDVDLVLARHESLSYSSEEHDRDLLPARSTE